MKTANSKKITPEKDVVKAILQAFSPDGYGRDIVLFRRNVMAQTLTGANGKKRFVRAAEPGQSDVWGVCTSRCPRCGLVRKGIHLEIECKNETNKPTAEQAAWIVKIRHLGGIAFILRPDKETGIFNIQQSVIDNVNCLCPSCAGNQSEPENKPTSETGLRKSGAVKTVSVEEYKKLLAK